MSPSSLLHRKLFIHPPHRTVGVVGGRTAVGSCERSGDGHSEEMPWRSMTIRVLSHPQDFCALPIRQALQRLLSAQCAERGYCVDWSNGDLSEHLGTQDRVILLANGIHMARHGEDLRALAPSKWETGFEAPFQVPFDLEIRPAGGRHCVVDGVGPFRCGGWLHCPRPLPPHANSVLVAHCADAIWPAAWVWQGAGGRCFSTILSGTALSRESRFACLLQNALQWIME